MTKLDNTLPAVGCRMTNTRKAIIQVLSEQKRPLTATEILVFAREIQHRLGLVTVYRTLNLLTKEKMVRIIHSDEGCHLYQIASPGHHHVVICSACGNAAEFFGGDDIEPLIKRVEEQTGYKITGHLLQLYGLCKNCASQTHSTKHQEK